MVALSYILFAAASVSAGLIGTRDAATVLADLKTVDADVKSLNTAVKNWDGTTGGGAGIASAESTLENDIKKAGTDQGNTSTLSSSDCNTITNYISATLEPDVKAALTTIVSRKASAKSAGIQSAVTQDLKNIQAEFDAFYAKVPSTCTTTIKPTKTKLDADFSSAIASFSS